MLKKHPFLASNFIERFLIDFTKFTHFFSLYLSKKIIVISGIFEKNKNILVRFIMMKRGRYARPFLHIATISVIGVGILLSPLLSSTYPIFTKGATTASVGQGQNQSIIVGDNIFGTRISDKPRDKIIESFSSLFGSSFVMAYLLYNSTTSYLNKKNAYPLSESSIKIIEDRSFAWQKKCKEKAFKEVSTDELNAELAPLNLSKEFIEALKL